MRRRALALYATFVTATFVSLWGSFSLAADPAGSVEFFESRIRPVLVEHCFECHSSAAEEIGGSLWLDSADAMRNGGDSGPAISPGNAAASLLVSAIRYESTEMPPAGKLPDSTIADFEAWIAAGAVDPRKQEASKRTPAISISQAEMGPSSIDIEMGRQFWAFQPIEQSPEPEFSDRTSASTVDAFLDRQLLDANIEANSKADPLVRLRRLAFDLTGLPPSDQLQQEWLTEPSSRHWRKIVDAMLASHQFGEHWGRHWLDVVRYADSNGSDFNATFHDAWRYRDYVIDSFNRDRPFDQFVQQQIAGDLMTAADDQERSNQIVATTFLTLGTKMLSERDKLKLQMDVVDEQIDAVGRAFLGLTLGCARCHDHKFDPVPSSDYYALAGIFRSTVTLQGESQKYVSTWPKTPLPVDTALVLAHERHQQEIKALKAQLKEADASLKKLKDATDSPLAGVTIDDSEAEKIGPWTESTYYKHFIGAGYVHDDNSSRGQLSIRFATRLKSGGEYEVRIAHSPQSNRSSRVAVVVDTADGPVEVSLDQRTTTHEPVWSTIGTFRFSDVHIAAVTIHNRDSDGYVIADAVQFIPAAVASDEKLRDVHGTPHLVEQATTRVTELTQQIKAAEQDAPPPLPTAMAVFDAPAVEIGDGPICIRGEPRNLGPAVPRGFLQVCSSGTAVIPQPTGSGRMELATWLTAPNHPLVARVIINRVWMYLMGEGIVRSVDNFGSRGELPSHPELLDALALQLIGGDWQLKPIIRYIVCSDAYNRSSEFSDLSYEKDPENRLWWRMPRRRLPAEAICDTMLVVAGVLDHRPLSNPVGQFGTLVSSNNADSAANTSANNNSQRAVYQPVIRSYMSPLMTMLDAADPDLIVGRRPTTNVPSQALVLVNSPEVNRLAGTAASRIVAEATDFPSRLSLLYRLALQREPTCRDIEIATSFGLDDNSTKQAWHEYTVAVFAGTEFRLLD